MNELQLFNFENNQVRTLLINNEPWFVGKDITDILGYQNSSRDINRHVHEEDRQNYQNGTFDSPRGMTIINESGLYALIFGSKLESAKRFKHWVTSEVLPQIRKTGSYATPQLTGEELMAKALIEAKSIMERQNKEITEMKPKALFADTVSASDNSILVGQEAKLISQRGFKVGQNRFFAWLREHGYLCSKGENYNMPTQKSREMNLIEIKIRTVANPDGSVRETKTPVITGKGQVYFVNKYIEKSNAES